MYLLDTNICIYIINKKPVTILEQLKQKQSKRIAISTITLAELEHGVENSRYPEKNSIALLKFLAIIDILQFDEKAAKIYGKVKTDLKHRGELIGPLDMLIAAHAKSQNLIVVTNNTDEFERIKDLRVENWV